jgi:hypothetical protein
MGQARRSGRGPLALLSGVALGLLVAAPRPAPGPACGTDAPEGASSHAYYVAPDGDDANDGNSTSTPWMTLRHAIDQLRAGDVLFVRGGTYRESGIDVAVAGTAGAPITIRNFPGEHPVVDGAWAEFETPGNQAWELVDAAKQIWRSVQTYPGAGEVYGFLGADDGGWRLVPYESSEPFGTDNEDYAEDAPLYYIGPGVYWDPTDERIYYRSKPSKYQVGDTAVPHQADPRETELQLFPKGEVLEIDSGCSYVVIEGLDIRNRYNALHFQPGAHHVTVRDCALKGGRYHVLVRGGAHDLVFDGLTVHDRFPDWVAWSDVKRPTTGGPGHLFQGAAIHLVGDVDQVEIVHGSFTGLFDAIGAGQAPTHLRVHHNVFDVRDDVLQLGSAGWDVEFDHNRVLRAHSGGPSWNGSGSAPADKVGTVYIHHNLIDTSQPQRFGRSDPLGLLDDEFLGPLGDGFAAGRSFGCHDKGAITGPTPWKIYHNTAILTADESHGGAGQAYRIAAFDTQHPHEVYNNIFLQLGDQWILRDARAEDGSQIHDGNLYWAPHRAPGTDLLEDVWDREASHDFPSLAGFLGSPVWKTTQAYYAPGWERSGVEADPELDSGMHPDPDGPAASGAVDLSAKGWPGLCGETFRGALEPHARPALQAEPPVK